MCGRFITKGTWAEYRALLDLTNKAAGINDPARYNVAPTQDVRFVALQDDEREVLEGRWWLVPFWAKEMPKYTLFNARSEDAHTKPAFRDAFKSKRCLIPADGYYEWTKNAEDGGKEPWAIHLPDWHPFAFAGLWAHNDHLDVTSCTILTAATPKGIEISGLHNRVPVILPKDHFSAWIDPDTTVGDARDLLKDHLAGDLTAHRVSRKVNSSKAQGPQLIEPV